MSDGPNTAIFETAPDEADLVERLRSGDDAAYEYIVREYGGRLFTVARRLMGNDADAQDALQDGLLSAFRSIDRFKGDAKLSTWLHRVVVNAALMRLRSQKRRRERAIDDLLPVFDDRGHHAARPRPFAPPSDDFLLRQETRAKVRAHIDELPEEYREVLLLRDIEELDTAETAAVLEITSGAVKTRLHRARLALRTLLEADLS